MKGEIAVVTGGSSGIGLACARLLALEGARVYLVARDAQRLTQAAASIDGEVRTIALDLSSAAVDQLPGRLSESGERRVDLLLNCAGQLEVGPAELLGADVAERLMQINYLGPVRAIEALLPLLRNGRRRSIVTISSLAGHLAPPYMAAYSASKFAVNAYSCALRQELCREGFHVGLVAPGPVATAMTEGRIDTEHYPLLPGVPVLSAEQVALQVMHCIGSRRIELILPRRLALGRRLLAAFPGLVDYLYRRYTTATQPRCNGSQTQPSGGCTGEDTALESERLSAGSAPLDGQNPR